jgi:ubiquinone/menaquinone biosynthesis C-methylase UbiE
MDSKYLSALRSDSFWDLYSYVYTGVYHLIPYRNLLWDAYEELDLQPGARVLDAGCGTGNFEHFISTKPLPDNVTIDGIDASAGMLNAARRRCAELDFARFSAADLNERLPFDDATFDRVVSINVLYALKDQDHALSEMLRVLKPRGRLVISSPLPTYRVSPMVADHFRRIGNIWGLRRRVARVVGSALVLATTGLAQWVLNDLIIDARETQGLYRSLDEHEVETLLERLLPDGLGDLAVRLASANQNVLATAVKAVPA